ncbi:hypothetical protein JCM39194_00290 [Desulfotomaculum varum]
MRPLDSMKRMTATPKKMMSILKENGKKQKINGKGVFAPGDIITVKNLLYSDKPGGKTRPAVVLSSLEHNTTRLDLVVAKISGSTARDHWEVNIKKWLEAGLRKPSKVVTDHLTVVPKASVKLIGHLDTDTMAEVKNKIGLLLGY